MRMKTESHRLVIFGIVPVTFPLETAACLDVLPQMLLGRPFSPFPWLNIDITCLVFLCFVHSTLSCCTVCLLLSYFMWRNISWIWTDVQQRLLGSGSLRSPSRYGWKQSPCARGRPRCRAHFSAPLPPRAHALWGSRGRPGWARGLRRGSAGGGSVPALGGRGTGCQLLAVKFESVT